ncbi:MAG: hypothetical protein MO846_04025 [Candidatus Devosia symbiotica]|nr:hypothetical protein [Candidatus Devosia symbiotica]
MASADPLADNPSDKLLLALAGMGAGFNAERTARRTQIAGGASVQTGILEIDIQQP